MLLPRVYKKGKESVVLRIAVCKRTLQSTKVKLRNITQNVPQTSGVVTATTVAVNINFTFRLRETIVERRVRSSETIAQQCEYDSLYFRVYVI